MVIWVRKQNGTLMLARVALALLVLAAALAVLSPHLQAGPEAGDETSVTPDTSQPSGMSLSQALAAIRAYYGFVLIMWLAAGAFVAGLLVGVAAPRHAGLWAAVAVAAFLGITWTVGAMLPPGRIYRALMFVGVLVVLTMAAAGGAIGQYLWRGIPRTRATPGDDAANG